MQEYVTSKNTADIVLDKPMSTREHMRVRLEQVKLLFNVSPHLIISSGFIAILFAMMQWDAVEHMTILIWLACMGVVVICRLIVLYTFSLKQLSLKVVAHWEKLYMLTVLALGLVWGATGIVFFPQGNLESQILTIFTLVFLTGVVAARPMLLREAFFIFLLCAMLPIIIQLALLGTTMALKLMAACVLYGGFLSIYANTSYKLHMKNILFQVRYLDHEKVTQTSQYMSKKRLKF